jgi:hypothetical protein
MCREKEIEGVEGMETSAMCEIALGDCFGRIP